MSAPAVSFFPETLAPWSSFTSATGRRSSLPYGSQKDHRYRAPYSSGSSRSEARAALGSLPRPKRLSSSAASLGECIHLLLLVSLVLLRFPLARRRREGGRHGDGAFGRLAAHRDDGRPGLGERPQQGPHLGPFGVRQLEVGVVHTQQS